VRRVSGVSGVRVLKSAQELVPLPSKSATRQALLAKREKNSVKNDVRNDAVRGCAMKGGCLCSAEAVQRML
jgi:hypothetical protein